ncbi:MAG TPA: hypothetical protein VN851_04975 [Thermoanaerobaculia bacterium]|nr:hypothetical protein [Thermoanaerobaculia bacterium]
MSISNETRSAFPGIRYPRVALMLSLACVALAVAFAWRTAGIAIDDFFITYRYAWHLAHGDGLVFNLGEPVFGLSNPGLALVLAALHLATGARIEILATIVFAAGLLGIVACLLRSAPREIWTEILPGGVLLLSSPFVWRAQGSETALALCLLLASALFAERRPILAGLLGGTAVWVRPDTGLGLAVLGLLLIRERRRLPWAWAISAAAVILAGAFAAYAAFGTVLPETFASKRYLAEISGGSGFLGHSFWGAGLSTWLQLSGILGVAILLFGLVELPGIYRRWGICGRVLVGYGAVNALVYPLFGVPFSIWYVFPFAAAILFGAGAAVSSTLRRAKEAHRAGRRTLYVLGSIAVLIVNWTFIGSIFWNLSWLEDFAEVPRQQAYREAALWIRQNSAPDESIAFGEIGVLGYTSDRTVEDLMGLVTPRSLPYIAKKDLLGAFLAHPTPLVLFHTERRSTRPIVSQPWFRRAYREVARFPQSDGGGEVVVFRRVPGRAIPPPRPPRGAPRGAEPASGFNRSLGGSGSSTPAHPPRPAVPPTLAEGAAFREPG